MWWRSGLGCDTPTSSSPHSWPHIPHFTLLDFHTFFTQLTTSLTTSHPKISTIHQEAHNLSSLRLPLSSLFCDSSRLFVLRPPSLVSSLSFLIFEIRNMVEFYWFSIFSWAELQFTLVLLSYYCILVRLAHVE